MVKCELCGMEIDDPQEFYGKKLCGDCYAYYEERENRRFRGCCFCR